METLTQTTPLIYWEDGTIRVAGSRVTLDSIVNQFEAGASAEQILDDFPSLSLRDIYAVLAFYLEQKEFVKDYLSQQRIAVADTHAFLEEALPSANIRNSIRQRQRNQTPR